MNNLNSHDEQSWEMEYRNGSGSGNGNGGSKGNAVNTRKRTQSIYDDYMKHKWRENWNIHLIILFYVKINYLNEQNLQSKNFFHRKLLAENSIEGDHYYKIVFYLGSRIMKGNQKDRKTKTSKVLTLLMGLINEVLITLHYITLVI